MYISFTVYMDRLALPSANSEGQLLIFVLVVLIVVLVNRNHYYYYYYYYQADVIP